MKLSRNELAFEILKTKAGATQEQSIKLAVNFSFKLADAFLAEADKVEEAEEPEQKAE